MPVFPHLLQLQCLNNYRDRHLCQSVYNVHLCPLLPCQWMTEQTSGWLSSYTCEQSCKLLLFWGKCLILSNCVMTVIVSTCDPHNNPLSEFHKSHRWQSSTVIDIKERGLFGLEGKSFICPGSGRSLYLLSLSHDCVFTCQRLACVFLSPLILLNLTRGR